MPTLKGNAIPEYVLHTPAHMVYIYILCGCLCVCLCDEYQLHDISTLTSL